MPLFDRVDDKILLSFSFMAESFGPWPSGEWNSSRLRHKELSLLLSLSFRLTKNSTHFEMFGHSFANF